MVIPGATRGLLTVAGRGTLGLGATACDRVPGERGEYPAARPDQPADRCAGPAVRAGRLRRRRLGDDPSDLDVLGERKLLPDGEAVERDRVLLLERERDHRVEVRQRDQLVGSAD